ncbi:MAG: saccharopine dehydrogenase NADP-binding domain-containing protein [Candidatus Thermoplasmatota archaeon]|nr:saccharopine dehydrogenase NADP-binding domain-containing protein [Candidatus Thermoplasmatota archaeon]MBU1941531.1 saccharopine dehydrogenase NADP-binding domain-containing protein [Candidatus Thermoplasmatota archaeon]
MKKILVLGAGMVSRPLVRYLLDQSDCQVTMASRTVQKAEECIEHHPSGIAQSLDCTNNTELEDLVTNADVVVSLLPYVYHVQVAKFCIKHSKHLVTTSYVSEDMRTLDKPAKKAGILLLNECGLDPGIDHMSAMRIIHDVSYKGGIIKSFRSTTGALPSHEANTNPFGYKFSWSPRGVLLASRNPAQWLQDGNIISIPGKKLFENYTLQDVPTVGTFENYPNRNSVPYKDIYGLKDAQTVYRGTFRMAGWCETMRYLTTLGWLQDTPLTNFNGITYADVTRFLIKAAQTDDLYQATATSLDLTPYATVMKRLQWLGLFSTTKKLPTGRNSPLDWLNVITLEKMALHKNERDMIVMHHEFIAEYPDKTDYITSTLVNYGIPNGDSAVARTVALPAAIAVKMIINGTITLTGVHIPVTPSIYTPILDELETMDIRFTEATTPLSFG